MKNIFKKSLAVILILNGNMFTSCVTTNVANLQRSSNDKMDVFVVKTPDREYTELKYIQANGSIFHTPEQLLNKLTQRAKKEGADAIMNVKYDFQNAWPIASATAIKYKN